MLEELKDILSSLYMRYGLTDDTLKLSQLVDKLIYQEQFKRARKGDYLC